MRARRRWVEKAAIIGVASLVAGTGLGVGEGAPSASAASAGRGTGTPTQGARAAVSSWLPQTPAGWPLVVTRSATPAETITRGVTEQASTLDSVGGAQQIHVMKVDMADPNVRVGAVEAGDTVIDPSDETLSSMGARTGALGGINGGYFDINKSGQPDGGSIVNGQILKTPPAGFNAELSLMPDGKVVIGQENWSGSITDGSASTTLASINVPADAASGHITEVTPALASTAQTLTTPATVVTGTLSTDGQSLSVTGVNRAVTTLQIPAPGTVDLVGSGSGGTWLSSEVSAGQVLSLKSGFAQGSTPTDLITAVGQMIKNGQAWNDPTQQYPGAGSVNPETAVGVTKDGRHLILLTIDGRLGESASEGVTWQQVQGYLLEQGAYNAVLLDGGGSTEMVARNPGTTGLSVLNTPSDGDERPVANGLFVYSTAKAPGAATKVVVNAGETLWTVPGATVQAPVYATDAADNPAASSVRVKVVPASLGTWSAGRFSAAGAGSGKLVATSNGVTSSQAIHVVSSLSALSLTPGQPDVNNGATLQLSLSGTDAQGDQIQIPAQAASWSIADPDLGSVSSGGLLTAASDGGGMTTVTATVLGTTATVSVAIGSVPAVVDSMADLSTWSVQQLGGASGSISADPGVIPPGDTASASTKVTYNYPAGSGVKQVVLAPQAGQTVTTNADGQQPTGIGMWIKGSGAGPELAESYIDVDGTAATVYPTTITWEGWQLVVAELPAGLTYPLTVNFVDFLTISNPEQISGSIDVADLEALYSPRPATTPTYTAIPSNPSWLRFTQSPGAFSPGGTTLMAGGDAGLSAADTASAGSTALSAVAHQVAQLTGPAFPQALQATGDMSATASSADLTYTESELASLGVQPYRALVGAGETSSGTVPENTAFASIFGDTHYAYKVGRNLQVIVTDSAHGGITASDPYQSPAGDQYLWLARQLQSANAPVVVVATTLPAYDPLSGGTSQFSDSWEAEMYLQLVADWQKAHRSQHVVMLSGSSGGVSEQILDPAGQAVAPGYGIPQLSSADLGAGAGLPADQGGFENFLLLHATASGGLQFDIEPVLSGLAIAPASEQLTPGTSEQLTATGAQAGQAAQVPIADPMSHRWSSSDAKVVSVNPVSGVITARKVGGATITLTAGGRSTSVPITVGQAG